MTTTTATMDSHHAPHESPWVVTVPLVLLAIPSVVIGFMTIQPMLFGDFFKDAIWVDAAKHPAWRTGRRFPRPCADGAACLHTAAVLAGAGRRGGCRTTCTWSTRRCRQPSSAGAADLHLLENKYYLDWFNENVLARGARAGHGLWKGGDQAVIDGFLVNGSWKIVGWVSARCAGSRRAICTTMRCHDSGRVCAHDVFRLAQQVGEEEKWVC
jgi:NADH-quinone oxidoreductase subunit L